MVQELTLKEAMLERHSVRSYLDAPVPEEIREDLDALCSALAKAHDVHIRIVYDDPEGFDSRLARYGRFRNVRNYIVFSAPKGQDRDEEAGYAGEQLVLRAQQLGLRTCWAKITFNRHAVRRLLPEGDSLIIVIALGYGDGDGTAHRNRDADVLAGRTPGDPDWYREGIEAALTAPTAVNQQKFRLTREGSTVRLMHTGIGPCLRIDLGIVRYHFEIGAGTEHFTWAKDG